MEVLFLWQRASRRFLAAALGLFALAGCFSTPKTESVEDRNKVDELHLACAIIAVPGEDPPLAENPAPSREEEVELAVDEMVAEPVTLAVEESLREGGRLSAFLEPFSEKDGLIDDQREPLRRNVSAERLRLSLLVRICFSHPDPEIAAEVANLYAEKSITYQLERSIELLSNFVEDLRVRAEQQKAVVEGLESKEAKLRLELEAASSNETDAAPNPSGSTGDASEAVGIDRSKARAELAHLRKELERQRPIYGALIEEMQKALRDAAGQSPKLRIVDRAVAPLR